MTSHQLNAHQRRHVATYLRLLLEDLEDLETAADGAPSAARDRVTSALRDVAAAARTIGTTFGLPLERPRDFRRHVGAVADAWALRTYEIEAERLAAYGGVDAEVRPALDPLVRTLRERLYHLAAAARSTDP